MSTQIYSVRLILSPLFYSKQRYHDMQNVVDFFVLKQVYEQSLQREWQPGEHFHLFASCLFIKIEIKKILVFILWHKGDRFRSVIDDCWWSGVVTEVSPYENETPESHFQCYVVRCVC